MGIWVTHPGGGGTNVVNSLVDASEADKNKLRLLLASGSKKMKGINLGAFFEVPWEGANGSDFSKVQKVARKIVDAGFDHVRLPIRWTNYMSTDSSGIIDPTFLSKVTSAVDTFLLNNLVVIINFHHYRQLEGDSLDNSGSPLFLGDPLNVAAGDVRPRLLNGWRQVATAFLGYGPALMFEAYNEAHGLLDETDTNSQSTRWSLFYPTILDAIREIDTTRTILFGGSNYNNTDALNWMTPPSTSYNPLALTYHNYLPVTHSHQGVDGRPTGITLQGSDRVHMRASNFSAKYYAETLGYTAHLGEFGTVNYATDQILAVAVQRYEAELAGNGWCLWTDWANPNPGAFNVMDATTLEWYPGLLDALFAPGQPAGAPAYPSNILTIPTNQSWQQWGGSLQPTVNSAGKVTWPSVSSRHAVAGAITSPITLTAGMKLQYSNFGLGNCRYALGVRTKNDPSATYNIGQFIYPGQTKTFTVPEFTGGNDAMNTWPLFVQAESSTSGTSYFSPHVCVVT